MTSTVFLPAPIHELPIVKDPISGDMIFSPIWLNWFLQWSKNLNAQGVVDPGTEPNVVAGQIFLNHDGLPTQSLLYQAQRLMEGQIFARRLNTDFPAEITAITDWFTFSQIGRRPESSNSLLQVGSTILETQIFGA